ncbi:MAG: ABC transporter permease [Acidimicrobiales bacterium]|nr:ABC transporter permease [Acidimicrobiales bacterium]
MDTPDRTNSTAAGGDNLSAEPGGLSTLPLEDIGVDPEADIKHQKKGKFGVLFAFSLFWLVLILIFAVFADILPIPDPNFQDIGANRTPPLTDGYFLGTDNLGRDMFSRIVHGARVSVVISVTAVAAGMIFGGMLGLTAGYLRGRYESLVMGMVNTLLAFPGLVLLLALVALMGQNLLAVTAAVAFLSIPTYTRVARATTLAVSQREYVLASKALGAKRRRILMREIAPNVALPVAAFGLIALGTIIVLEGTLAFLGLSVQAPQATWGSMIFQGRRYFSEGDYFLTLIPAAVLFFTVFSLNYVGDAMRNRLDVREAQL